MIEQFNLDKSITFLNHGSFGACTKVVMDQYVKFQYELEKQPVDFIENRVPELLMKSRLKLSEFLGVSNKDIILVDNPTTAINEVIRSLELSDGDEIITTDHEYGAMDKAWEFITERTGSKYNIVELPFPVTSNDDVISTLKNKFSSKTKILFISHITSPTGIIFPVKELCDYARSKNVITIVDGAHAPGHIPLDISLINPDFYIGTCHKWLCTPKGVSFLYVKKNIQNLIDPLIIGWGWRDSESKLSPFINNHEWWGTRDMSAYFCLPIALDVHQSIKMKNARLNCLKKIPQIREVINSITQQFPICPVDMLGQMTSLVIPRFENTELKSKLINDYKIEIPIFKWKNMSILRVSYQVYNTDEDLDCLYNSLKKIL